MRGHDYRMKRFARLSRSTALSDLTLAELEAREASILGTISDAREALADPTYPARFHQGADTLIATGLSQLVAVREAITTTEEGQEEVSQ